MNATVTKQASRSSHGSAGQMAHAIARASKQHEETVAKVEALATHIVAAAKATPTKLFSVEELAQATGLSLSWIYQQISKDQPEVMGTHGKKLFYSSDYLETLKQRNARPRMRRVQIIARPIARKIEQVGNVTSTIKDIANQTEPLFDRLNRMEEETQHVEKMLTDICRVLGLAA